MDKSHIRDLKVQCVIGVNPEERNKKQDVIFNITLFSDQKNAAESDNINSTVDYDAAAEKVRRFVEGSSCKLIETLAGAVAKLLLDIDGVLACNVILDKPGVLKGTRSVGVEIYRRKETGSIRRNND